MTFNYEKHVKEVHSMLIEHNIECCEADITVLVEVDSSDTVIRCTNCKTKRLFKYDA